MCIVDSSLDIEVKRGDLAGTLSFVNSSLNFVVKRGKLAGTVCLLYSFINFEVERGKNCWKCMPCVWFSHFFNIEGRFSLICILCV